MEFRNIVILTGAGISADSGLATFRGADGLWEGHHVEDVATPEAFRRDPALVHQFYDARRARLSEVEPNAAHRALARLDAEWPGELLIVTQNVDDLHERAGSADVLHLHGQLDAARCFDCARPAGAVLELPEGAGDGKRIEPPLCSACGGPLRPGVVWFGENLPEQALSQAFLAAADCDLLLSIGTSGVVQPAAMIPGVALEAGARVVHINPQVTGAGHAREFALAGKAGELLPQLLREAFG